VKVTCAALGSSFELPGRDARVVSLVSSATETLEVLGAAESLVGVSPWCARYAPAVRAPVVGDYLAADPEAVRAVRPDLVLVTDGVQLPLARRLAAAGLPAYLLPVPQSRFGILENTVALGALSGRLAEARALSGELEQGCAALAASAPARRPRTYAELWFGRHPRRPGGRSFVHDLLWLAGAEPLFGDRPDGYAPLDLQETARRAPEVFLLFSEPEFPVDGAALLAERGWTGTGAPRLVRASVERGQNPIHDGPSFLETARWLRGQLLPP